MKQRQMATAFVKPIDSAELIAERELRMKEIQMEAILKEVIVYFIFVIVLFFLSYQARDLQSFNYAQNIKNTLVENSPTFESVGLYTWFLFRYVFLMSL